MIRGDASPYTAIFMQIPEVQAAIEDYQHFRDTLMMAVGLGEIEPSTGREFIENRQHYINEVNSIILYSVCVKVDEPLKPRPSWFVPPKVWPFHDKPIKEHAAQAIEGLRRKYNQGVSDE